MKKMGCKKYGGVLVVLVLLVMMGADAAEKDKDLKPLDLSNMRAHDKTVDVS